MLGGIALILRDAPSPYQNAGSGQSLYRARRPMCLRLLRFSVFRFVCLSVPQPRLAVSSCLYDFSHSGEELAHFANRVVVTHAHADAIGAAQGV